MRDSSPMEGLIFVNDIIIAINDVNTREYTAAQLTQMMKDTVDQERKITVLSSVRWLNQNVDLSKCVSH